MCFREIVVPGMKSRRTGLPAPHAGVADVSSTPLSLLKVWIAVNYKDARKSPSNRTLTNILSLGQCPEGCCANR